MDKIWEKFEDIDSKNQRKIIIYAAIQLLKAMNDHLID